MEEKSRYYKDVLQLHEENELQELFSPFNYIHDKISTNLGTGTGLFKSLSNALRHGDRNEYFSNIQYGVMGVEVPEDKYFYDAEKPLCDQNKYIQDCLFDSYALEVLFQFEFNRLKNKITWKIAEDKIVDTKKYRDEAFKKFYEENVLLNQLFIMDNSKKISDLLKEFEKANGASVEITDYVLFVLGEGIEKQTTDFAEEVASMMK